MLSQLQPTSRCLVRWEKPSRSYSLNVNSLQRGRKIFQQILGGTTLVTILFIILAWELIALNFANYVFPRTTVVVRNFWLIITNQTRWDFVEHTSMTLIRILIGFVLVMVSGTILGILMGLQQRFDDYFSTYIIILLTVPGVVWAFAGTLWFGITELVVPVFLIFMIVFPYVAITMWQGTKDIDEGVINMANSFHASRYQIWRYVYIPYLTPYTFSNMRLAMTIAWKLCLVGEIFGASSGIGVIVNFYYEGFQNDMIIAWALPIILLMFIIERIFRRVEKYAYRWKPDEVGEEEQLAVG